MNSTTLLGETRTEGVWKDRTKKGGPEVVSRPLLCVEYESGDRRKSCSGVSDFLLPVNKGEGPHPEEETISISRKSHTVEERKVGTQTLCHQLSC